MEILQWLHDISIVTNFKVLKYYNWENGFYYKVRIQIKDNTSLHAKEYKDINERSYSFHWQNENNRLIIRWDNAPHHRYIKTFPHHKHLPDKIEESVPMTLDEALQTIEELIN